MTDTYTVRELQFTDDKATAVILNMVTDDCPPCGMMVGVLNGGYHDRVMDGCCDDHIQAAKDWLDTQGDLDDFDVSGNIEHVVTDVPNNRELYRF